MKVAGAVSNLNDLYKRRNRLYISKLSHFAYIHFCILVNETYKTYKKVVNIKKKHEKNK